ncbi:hypothetical protein CC80DRAFT_542107 [Byssothecium circinans]|uniref:Uncharacterized protein n=1 Tax=Byssothecium circinans TaxID=147558 RepID=A0A6A5UDG3_9PLEO|nr:hypothetical protein CC80DRAFT_542107 [Byssothecium circinans]
MATIPGLFSATTAPRNGMSQEVSVSRTCRFTRPHRSARHHGFSNHTAKTTPVCLNGHRRAHEAATCRGGFWDMYSEHDPVDERAPQSMSKYGSVSTGEDGGCSRIYHITPKNDCERGLESNTSSGSGYDGGSEHEDVDEEFEAVVVPMPKIRPTKHQQRMHYGTFADETAGEDFSGGESVGRKQNTPSFTTLFKLFDGICGVCLPLIKNGERRRGRTRSGDVSNWNTDAGELDEEGAGPITDGF